MAFLRLITPVPVMALMGDGDRLLEALRWLESQCRAQALSEEVLRHYHRTLFRREGEIAPGAYRTRDIALLQSRIPRPAPAKVPALMKQLDGKLGQEQARLDAAARPAVEEVLRVAAEVHQRIGFIHPFGDGNGRVARLAMNHLMRRYDGPYVILPPLSESEELFRAIQEAHRGDAEPFLALARRHLVRV